MLMWVSLGLSFLTMFSILAIINCQLAYSSFEKKDSSFKFDLEKELDPLGKLDKTFIPKKSIPENKMLSDYTVLLYMVGSDLEIDANKDIKELINASTLNKSNSVNIVLQTGGGRDLGINSTTNISSPVDFSTVKRHVISNGSITSNDIGLYNMGESSTLSDFLYWAALKYPAKNYVIILWDHGNGLNGFGKDMQFQGDALDPLEMKMAFDWAYTLTGNPFELIGFDACLMSSYEIAAYLYEYGDYLISSQELEPPTGWDYYSIIENLLINSNSSGLSIGKSIVDSYASSNKNSGEKKSLTKNLNGYLNQGYTLSVINLTKFPNLLNTFGLFTKGLEPEIYNLDSAMKFLKSVEQTEKYGVSSRGSSGMVDLYNLVTNLQKTFPELHSIIDDLRDELKDVVIYNYNGLSKPNAHGISIYLPMDERDFNSNADLHTYQFGNWAKIILNLQMQIETDIIPPVLQSFQEKGNISVLIPGHDVSGISREIITKTIGERYQRFIQNIDLSTLNPNSSLELEGRKYLSLCLDGKCTPVLGSIESNAERKFMHIPVRIGPGFDQESKEASLLFEMMGTDNFRFEGVIPEIKQTETVSKERIEILPGYVLYLKALSADPLLYQKHPELCQRLTDDAPYEENGPIIVTDPTSMQLKVRYFDSNASVRYVASDYSDNCGQTRWYNISNFEAESLLVSNLKSDIIRNGSSPTNSLRYLNYDYGMSLQIPAGWNIFEQYAALKDPKSKPMGDPFVAGLVPSNSQPNSMFTLRIDVTDWPNTVSSEQTYSIFLNDLDLLRNGSQILQSTSIVKDNNLIYRYVVKYDTGEKEYVEGLASILANSRLYNLHFKATSDEFDLHKNNIEEIVNSITFF